ncbi:uncharacterized protein EKO05_0008253 [Ascochyta rabiei]|uniref:uncharacterized protein n=1 Tax=Didymella rabiei TaxID=5454 RepID=UPI00220004A8|nr:uncharacterized protein EKO05_0008253 [Ascochyta rabiei]UPX17927.1 hypothetical protein EKO05_0008253 [Ascochyta rabiei]
MTLDRGFVYLTNSLPRAKPSPEATKTSSEYTFANRCTQSTKPPTYRSACFQQPVQQQSRAPLPIRRDGSELREVAKTSSEHRRKLYNPAHK